MDIHPFIQAQQRPSGFAALPTSSGEPSFTSLAAHDRGFAGSLRSAQRDFNGAVGRAELDPNATPEAQARESAERFVAQSLVTPILKSLREQSETPPPFGPGEGEKAFRGIADAQVALDLVRGRGFPLVDRVAAQLLRQQEQHAHPIAGAPDPSQTPPPANMSLPHPTPRLGVAQ